MEAFLEKTTRCNVPTLVQAAVQHATHLCQTAPVACDGTCSCLSYHLSQLQRIINENGTATAATLRDILTVLYRSDTQCEATRHFARSIFCQIAEYIDNWCYGHVLEASVIRYHMVSKTHGQTSDLELKRDSGIWYTAICGSRQICEATTSDDSVALHAM